ncbi:hypothetical protein [Streptomyces sp. NBC_00094]|uniref:hypothetical protein n=1 Tax=Streptomyces sp. NBC_00094 TaxID=2903620 RepID=UPI00225487C9|nr:hypothetical protein [Streptomyces sp. NBC_00094]MCX5392158.1 hypothetical protein [Streptomyces sp. NBC_00094]
MNVPIEPMAPTEPAAEAPRKPKRGARRILLGVVLPAVLVLGAAGGGVTYTAVTVSSADRTAPTEVWGSADSTATDKDPAESAARGKAGTPLSKLLLPVPPGYELGPDHELYGNDGELGEAEAVAQMKQEGEGLSGKKRRAYEKEVDRLGIQGIAVRSFSDLSDAAVISVHITRMKDKKRIKDSFRLRKEVLEALEFPKGPKVKDHRNAACYLMPEDKTVEKKEREEQLDGMVCIAYDSEVMVSVTASGAKPFDRAGVADLLKQQLDHIESPGEYV